MEGPAFGRCFRALECRTEGRVCDGAGRPGSVGGGVDGLATDPGAEGLVSDQVDGALDETDRPVREQEVAAAAVVAAEPPLSSPAKIRP